MTDLDLTKLTVNLVPRATDAVAWASACTGDTHTDVVNRALQVYAMVVDPNPPTRITLDDPCAGEQIVVRVRRKRGRRG
jgi:hypothetical protein